MRTSTSSYALALLLSGTMVAAQDARVTTDTKVKADGEVVTMIGCLEIGGGTSFVLTNIASEKDQHGRHLAASDGSQALVGRKGLDLGAYIQRKVELTGVVVPAATKRDTQEKIRIKETTRGETNNRPDKTSSETTTVKIARGAATQFLVASVKALSPSCQP